MRRTGLAFAARKGGSRDAVRHPSGVRAYLACRTDPGRHGFICKTSLASGDELCNDACEAGRKGENFGGSAPVSISQHDKVNPYFLGSRAPGWGTKGLTTLRGGEGGF